MATPPRQEGSENLHRAPPNKNLFQWNCDGDSDNEETPALQSFHRPALQPAQEKNVIDDVLETAMAESHDADTGARESQKKEESNELFVSDDEEQPERTPPPQDNATIESEPDEDDFCMIIDSAQASSDAQAKWAKPLKLTIDLTGDNQDATETEKIIKADPVTVKIEQADGWTFVPQHQTSQSSCLSSDAYSSMDKRMTELKTKATTGSLSDAEFEELLQITRQLQDVKAAAERGVVSDGQPKGQSNSDGKERKSGGKVKKTRKPAVRSAAEYWARREADDIEKQNELQDKSRKRSSKSKSSIVAKRGNQNHSSASFVDYGNMSDDEASADQEVERQISEMIRPLDAILERAKEGELPAVPDIKATRKEEQLRRMREEAPEYFEEWLLDKQEQELRESTKAWGPRKVRARHGKWEVRRVLSTPLHNHQIIVGAWMMGRELRNTPGLPRGGMLADAMGLGKTIEALSCIAGNPAPEGLRDKGQAATLVICPSQQMIGVWITEIKKHCTAKFAKSMVQYKRQNKMDVELLGSFNIVLATYHQVRASTPSAKEREEKQKEFVDDDKYQEWLHEQTGDLHRIKWYRIVLDEAHAIKNHLTHGAFSCFELESKYRWALSGTPLINSDTEFFPYFKFIRCHGINDFNDYIREYHESQRARQKRMRLVQQFVYRRTQLDRFLGQPILNLPTTHPTHQYVELSKEESAILKMMEACYRRQINADIEHGQAESQIRSYLTMLLRLRQAATHPFLLEGMMDKHFSIENIRTLRENLADLKGEKTIYEQIGSWAQRHKMSNERIQKILQEAERRAQMNAKFTSYGTFDDDGSDSESAVEVQASSSVPATPNKESSLAQAIVIDDGDDADEVQSQDEAEEDSDGMAPREYLGANRVENDHMETTMPHSERLEDQYLDPFGQSDFGLHFVMDKQLEYLERLKELQNAKCTICNSPPQIPVKGKCGCVFCTRCLMNYATTKVRWHKTLYEPSPLTVSKGRSCPKCRKLFGRPQSMEPFQSDDFDDNAGPGTDARLNQKKKGGKGYSLGFVHNNFQHYEDDRKDKTPSRFLQISDKQIDIPVTPSGKMAALKETVLRWQAEAPEDKIIIFSQFHVVMKIAGRMLEAEGIKFNYLSGKQTTDQREKAVRDFQGGEEVKVLIVSLRAGGQCLTLTRANRVIQMELWWNHAVGQQAFARVFRMGQIRETHFVRFIVNTPIEKRMLGMQVDKILRIDAALQDEGVRNPKIEIDLEDIGSLIGKVVKENGRIVRIDADNDAEGYGNLGDVDGDGNEDGEEEDLEGFVVPDDVIEVDDSDENTGGLDSDDE